MATVIAAPEPRSDKRHPFAPRHPWDRNFFLTYVVLIWGAIIAGFGEDIIQRFRKVDHPAIVYVHAVAFVGWLILLTVQVLLIRSRKVRIHRRVGLAGVFLAAAMIVLGPAAALTTGKADLSGPNAAPQFLSVQLSDLVEFAALAAAAVSARKEPAAHKRLMLLATLSLVDAGFGRFLGDPLTRMLGNGIWQFWVSGYAPSLVLILGIGCYDWATRRRLHPAYVFGAAWILVGQVTASWLFYSPAWKAVATSMTRAWPW